MLFHQSIIAVIIFEPDKGFTTLQYVPDPIEFGHEGLGGAVSYLNLEQRVIRLRPVRCMFNPPPHMNKDGPLQPSLRLCDGTLCHDILKCFIHRGTQPRCKSVRSCIPPEL